MSMKTITRIGKAQRQDDGTVVLSTDTPCAQDGLALRLDGWDLGRAREGRVKASYNHHTNGPEDLPVALWENVRVEEGRGLVGDGPLFASEMYPLAAIAEKMWRHDPPFLDDVSVTFKVNWDKLGPEMVRDGVRYQESYEHELVEAAVVFLGADQNAGKGRLEEAVTRGVITADEAAALDAVRSLTTDNDELLRKVDELTRALEARDEELDRLRGELAARTPPVLKIAATPAQPKDERITVSPAAIRQAVEEKVAATISAAAEDKLRVLRGRLPD